MGRAEGKENIRNFFKGTNKVIPLARHHVINPIIEVDGDSAKGHWLLFQPLVRSPGKGMPGEARWLGATYTDIYARTAKGWKIKYCNLEAAFDSSYEAGFAKERFPPKKSKM